MQGFAQQVLHLANPVFDGMTFVKGDKGGGMPCLAHSRKLRKSLLAVLQEVLFW
jgi:hypothetical protein